MKKILLFALLIPLSLGIAFLSGCGSSSGGGSSSSTPNGGTISGHVYSFNETTYAYTGLPGIFVNVSNEVMSHSVSAVTDTDGKYTLSGLPSGTLPVTVTEEGFGLTIVANSSTVNFVPDSSRDPGTATIYGSIESFPPDAIWNYEVDVYAYAASGREFDYDYYYNYDTHTFEVTGAPDDGDTYVYVDFWDGGQDSDVYAYNKVTTNKNSTYTYPYYL